MKARYLFVGVVIILLGVVMISASTSSGSSNPAESPSIKILNRDLESVATDFQASDNTSTFLPISAYLDSFHNHQFTHDREALVVIKFPSCDGTISRVFEYLDTTDYRHKISILGVKEKSETITDDFRKYYDSKLVNFRNHADHLRSNTNISVDYPELYFFEQGKEKEHLTANCNNFDQVIGNLEGFLSN